MSDRRRCSDPLILEALRVAQEHVATLNWRKGGAKEIATSIGRPGLAMMRRPAKQIVIAALAAEWLALKRGG